MKLVQEDSFSTDIHAIENSKNLPKGSKLVSLSPFIDSYGILCVGGRIKEAPTPSTAMHPIILPKDYHVTKLIIGDAH